MVAVYGQTLVIYERKSFQRDTTLGAWKPQLAMLHKLCAGMMIEKRFADMPFIRCNQEVSFFCRLQKAFDARTDIKDGDLQL